MMMRKLEIGPEKHRLGEDWETLDVVLKTDAHGKPLVDYLAFWGEERLPFDDGDFHEVYASHVIEHVPWYQTVAAFREVFRILMRGRRFEVHTVDFGIVVAVLNGAPVPETWDAGGRNAPFHPMRWIASRIFSYDRPEDENWHKAIFTEGYLRDCLHEAGFVDITFGHVPRGVHSHAAVNLGVQCWKP